VEQHVSVHPLIAAIALEILRKLAHLNAVTQAPQPIRLPLLLPLELPQLVRLPQLIRPPLPLGLPRRQLQHQQPQPQHLLGILQLAMGPTLIPQRMLALPMVQGNKCYARSQIPLHVELHVTLQLLTAARVEL
jgi:hypothetical protein